MEDQNSMENADIKEKIAALRNRYARLKATCGLQAISRETIAKYANALKALEAQLN